MKQFLRYFSCALLLSFAVNLRAQSPIVDYGFMPTLVSIQVNKVLVQPDGKILVGGSFTNYAGSGRDNLVRLNSDGTVDTTFCVYYSPNNAVYDIGLMQDGRIVICGNFVQYGPTQCSFVVRLQPDGMLDNTFSVQPNTINNPINALEIQDDEKVVIGGDFFICYGHSQPHITRLEYGGAVDTSFHMGTGFNNPVRDLMLLPDQRIMCGGDFIMYQGQLSLGICLVNPDGSQDTSFHTTNAFNSNGTASIHALARQADGKILAGGYFCYYNSQSIPGAIARLNMDGTRDAGFTSPLYPYSMVNAIAIQADSQIVMGGYFAASHYNSPFTGLGPEKIARLNLNGSLDTSFHVGTAFQNGNDAVLTLAIQPDTKIVVGGYFTYFDGETAYHHIIRLYENALSTTSIAEQNESTWSIYPNPAANAVTVDLSSLNNANVTIRVLNTMGEILHQEQTNASSHTLDLTGYAAGVYFVQVQGNGVLHTQALVVRQ